MRASSLWLFIAGVNGLIGVACGAYGRHGPLTTTGAEMFAFGSTYQILHALTLLGVASLAGAAGDHRRWSLNLAGLAFTLGIVLFSGSLYWLGWRETLLVEGAAPLGGWLLMLGWLALAISAVIGRPRTDRG